MNSVFIINVFFWGKCGAKRSLTVMCFRVNDLRRKANPIWSERLAAAWIGRFTSLLARALAAPSRLRPLLG